MDPVITCPNCQRKITGDPIIEDAAKGLGSDDRFIICECGERITYWQITAQLRNQKKASTKIQDWFHGLRKHHG
ncbi:MAG: hypothetical protein ACM3XO_16805 [Bacteroidota bacterium]